MCSWCYAFEPILEALTHQLPEPVRLHKLLGGLAPDSTEPMPAALQDTIRQTWLRIEHKVPGIRFNFDFWTLNTPVRSTYPACRAVLAATLQGRAYEVAMIRAIQSAYYHDARNPALTRTLVDCAEEIGLKVGRFQNDFESIKVDMELRRQIASVRSMGINFFPSLCLQHRNRCEVVRIDYVNEKPILSEIIGLINR